MTNPSHMIASTAIGFFQRIEDAAVITRAVDKTDEEWEEIARQR